MNILYQGRFNAISGHRMKYPVILEHELLEETEYFYIYKSDWQDIGIAAIRKDVERFSKNKEDIKEYLLKELDRNVKFLRRQLEEGIDCATEGRNKILNIC